jgi:hypothetical protein
MDNFNLYDDMSSNIKDLQTKRNLEINKNYSNSYSDNNYGDNNYGDNNYGDNNNIKKNKLDYLLDEPLIPTMYNKPINKKKIKKIEKNNYITSTDLFLLFILFIILNNYTLLTYINNNKITYNFSLVCRALLLIFIFYQYKKIA